MGSLNGPQVARLIALVESSWLEEALVAVRACEPGAYVGGGVVRTLVWDHLHGYPSPSYLRDVDVAFFDPSDLEVRREREVEACLGASRPDLPWEAKNQAAVHLWYSQTFGGPEVAPLASAEEGVATWPETATAVAVRLGETSLEVCAPCGLSDLFGMVLRRNPRRVSREVFLARAAEKRIRDRWPRVEIVY